VQLVLALGEQARAVEVLQRAGDAVGAARLQALKAGQFETASLVGTTRPRATAVGGHAISLPGAQKLEAAGKLDLALESYLQLKRFAEAAACAVKLGRIEDAAQLYADAGQPFEAAASYGQTGDTGKELENLVRVPRSDPRYREAAGRAIRLALELNAGVSFQLEHFLGSFAGEQPESAGDRETFYLLGCLYQQHDFAESAREAFSKVRGHRDADARAAELTRRPSESMARKVLEGADLHLRSQGLPDLDENPGTPYGFPQAPPALLPEEDPFADGLTIAGRYLIEQKIGQGGMAAVYRAHDLELDERVGLKVFGLENSSEMLISRFKQELKLSRQLQHPNIIRLYDIGLHQSHRYISMELLSGKSLKERMEQSIPFAEALGLLIQACAGLQAAHDAGVVHRDIKPDNLFVTNTGLLKVMDFGIARQFAVSGVTVAGSIAGTPIYMSPEQIGSFSTVTHATDLYALGVCAYEMFTGAVPFSHPQLVPLLMMHINEQPPAPRLKNPSIPPDLEAAILRLLAKDPAQRFASARELSALLESIRARYV
jgi:tetratricopeptide (TPR) repeat protein